MVTIKQNPLVKSSILEMDRNQVERKSVAWARSMGLNVACGHGVYQKTGRFFTRRKEES